MFRLYDSFRCYDDNLQPYCFSVEYHSETGNLHAGVCEDGFHLKSIGNRHILNTPTFMTGTFSTVLRFNYMREFDPRFTVWFQYDLTSRCGLGIRLRYDLAGSLELSLVSVSGTLVQVLERELLGDVQIGELQWVELTLQKQQEQLWCAVAGRTVRFPIACKPGKLALERDNFIGELILKELRFETQEEYEREALLPQ